MDTLAGIGDNSGGMDAAAQIKANLSEKHTDIVKRSGDLAGMIERAPKKVDTGEDADKISEAVRQCTAFIKNATATRVEEKEPYLEGGRSVDGFFNSLIAAVDKTKVALLQVRTDFDIRVETEARRKRDEDARVAREEADRLAAAAKTAAQLGTAAAAASRAEDAAEAAKVKPAELTRTRTDTGVVSSLRAEWRHEVTDPKKVPKKFMVPSDALIKGAVKAATLPDGSCPLDIPGVRIYEHKFSQVR